MTGLIAILVITLSTWYILRGFQWGEVGKLLGAANVGLFTLGVFIANVPYWHVRALRWWLLLRRGGNYVPYRSLHIVTMITVAFAPYTPGQLGEALKVEILRRTESIDRRIAYATFLVERALDFAFLLGLGLIGAASGGFPQLARFSWVLWAGIGALALAAFLGSRVSLGGALGRAQRELLSSLQHAPTNLAVVALTAAGWILVALGWKFVLLSIGIEISISALFGFMAAGTAMLILSFVPAGIGVWEAGGSLLLEAAGVQSAEAQAGALILRLFGIAALAWAAFRWMLWRQLGKKVHVDSSQDVDSRVDY